MTSRISVCLSRFPERALPETKIEAPAADDGIEAMCMRPTMLNLVLWGYLGITWRGFVDSITLRVYVHRLYTGRLADVLVDDDVSRWGRMAMERVQEGKKLQCSSLLRTYFLDKDTEILLQVRAFHTYKCVYVYIRT